MPAPATSDGGARRPRSPKGRAREVARRLALEYPEARCELDHENPFQLLAATILSAQTTDVRVNMVTPTLFARYPTPEALAGASLPELEEIVRSTGFYANKSRSLLGMAQALVERFDGRGPHPAGGPRHPAWRGPQDRQRGAQRGLRPARPPGRHPRRAIEPPPRAHDRPRPRQGRTDVELLFTGGRAGPVQPPDDPPRPPGVRCPFASLRGLCAGGHLPVVPGAHGPGPAPPTRRAVDERRSKT